ncbi:MAG: cell division protein FtsQ/DivIB [Aerococcaceae bacterium]|nr:cell division protein FtsQ/DivIB [Aerococcaceae bacterium]
MKGNYYQQQQRSLKERQVYQGNYRLDDQPKFSKTRYQQAQQSMEERYYQTQSAPLPKRDMRLLPRGVAKLASVVVLLFIAAWIASMQVGPLDKVNHLVVTGAVYSDVAQVERASNIRSWQSYKDVVAQKPTIEKNIIAANPMVDNITFHRSTWYGLELQVNEHHIVAQIEQNGQKIYLLDNGKPAPEGVVVDKTLPMLNHFSQHKLLEVTTMLRKLDASMLERIESIHLSQDITKPNTIDLNMYDGNTIRAVMSTFDKKAKYYPAILEQLGQQRGVVNLEIGAYFTPYSTPTNSVHLRVNDSR